MDIGTLAAIASIISGICNLIGVSRWVIPYLTKFLPLQPALQRFVDQLDVEDKREKAIIILTKSVEKNPKSIDYLVKILEDNDEELQKDGIYKILSNVSRTKIVTDKIIPIIESSEGNWRLQVECFNILGNIKTKDAIDILTKYINAEQWGLAVSAIANLGKIDYEISVDNLLLIPQNSHHQVLKALCSAFSSFKSIKALPYLYDLLNHGEPYVREAAANSIADIKENTGLGECLEVLGKRAKKEDDPEVMDAIAYAMRRINRNEGRISLLATYEYLNSNNKTELALKVGRRYEEYLRRKEAT